MTSNSNLLKELSKKACNLISEAKIQIKRMPNLKPHKHQFDKSEVYTILKELENIDQANEEK